MLTLITSRLAGPIDEPIDRDSGIITLAASLIRAVARRHDAAFQRRCDLAARTDHHTSV